MSTAVYWEPGLRIEHDTQVAAAAIVEALDGNGTLIKQSRRTTVRRVGEWAIKEAAARNPLQRLDLSFRPERYTKAWDLGLAMRKVGITVPAPLAVVSRQGYGLCSYRATVTAWLEGWQDVEDAARALHAAGADAEAIARFLDGIGVLYTRLSDAGFQHADLSGKNIYCKPRETGFEYALIDLDSAEARPVTPEMRFRNAVQLHDSFCDLWDDDILGPMVLAVMGVPDGDTGTLQRVVNAQKERRARIEAIWARQRTPR